LAIVLRDKRLASGLSQEELAHLCNIDRTYISLIERKKRKPTLNILFKVCEALKVSPSEFLKEVEKILYSNDY
jgi:transcriptional regulator with XRE-family HTH domain